MLIKVASLDVVVSEVDKKTVLSKFDSNWEAYTSGIVSQQN